MIVTRYLGSHLKETLATSELKVAKVSDFNDPFELRYRSVGEYGRDQAMIDFEDRLNSPGFWQTFQEKFQDDRRFAGMSKDEIIQRLKENPNGILESLVANNSSMRKEHVDGTHEYADATIRIICFSKPSDDPNDEMLRWSHYSNCHKGACIWLDLSKQEHPLRMGHSVRYRNSLVSIDNSRTGDKAYLEEKSEETMYTKANCWSYEGEVRSFIPKSSCISRESCGKVNDFVKFNLNGVTRIDFGIRFPLKEISQIINTYSPQLSESVRFFQAACSYDEYKIIYREIKAEQADAIRPR